MSSGPNLQAYFDRVGLSEAPRPTLEGLRTLHLAHATTIPFENLDIQMGLPIHLDLEHLQAKLVARRRGGYCFEQNTLFMAVLRELGFEVEAFEARVRMGGSGAARPSEAEWERATRCGVRPTEGSGAARPSEAEWEHATGCGVRPTKMTDLLPPTHMVLRVRLPEGDLLADVGFGGQGLLYPVPMDGQPHGQFREELRVVEEGSQRVLQTRQALVWQDLYAFVPEARAPIDFEVANGYTSTHPESRFVKTLTAQLPGPDLRHILRGLSYTVASAEGAEERVLRQEDLVPLLREVFGLEVPQDARFRSLPEG